MTVSLYQKHKVYEHWARNVVVVVVVVVVAVVVVVVAVPQLNTEDQPVCAPTPVMYR